MNVIQKCVVGTKSNIYASDKVYQLLAHDRWFSPGTPASSTTKTGRHDITEILLKVALNTIKQTNKQTNKQTSKQTNNTQGSIVDNKNVDI